MIKITTGIDDLQDHLRKRLAEAADEYLGWRHYRPYPSREDYRRYESATQHIRDQLVWLEMQKPLSWIIRRSA